MTLVNRSGFPFTRFFQSSELWPIPLDRTGVQGIDFDVLEQLFTYFDPMRRVTFLFHFPIYAQVLASSLLF